MKNTTITVGRLPRLYDESGEAWYHLYNRIACNKDDYPLEASGGKAALVKFIQFYSKAYECELVTYVAMGNHYHILARFPEFRELEKEELEERVKLFYPNTFGEAEHWSDEQWLRFNKRLFDVSSYMRNIQQGFASWFNKTYQHRGRVWADRFKSSLIFGEGTMLECMEYIDLNPIRAGLVERPEDYKEGALFRREIGESANLIDLKDILNEENEQQAYVEYKSIVYFRGSVKTKENQSEITQETLNEEIACSFKPRGVFKKRLRFFVDGLVLGPKIKVEEWLERCRQHHMYGDRKMPVAIPDGFGYSLRGQRDVRVKD